MLRFEAVNLLNDEIFSIMKFHFIYNRHFCLLFD